MVISALLKQISSCYIFHLQSYHFFTKSNNLFRSFTSSNSVISSGNNVTFTLNNKITSYFKNGDIYSAQKLFDEMPQRNVVTWNCMISGFVRNHRINEARQVFDAMPTKNLVSWTGMLSGYVECGQLEEARNLFDHIPNEVKSHACWDIMLKGYIKFGRVGDARGLFDQSNDRNIGLYNRMLSGYVQLGCVDEAYELFMSMPEHSLASLTCMITCYARAGLMENAKKMFDSIIFKKDVKVWTAVIRGYLQNGMVDEGLDLFSAMPNRDVVTWNCMISGLVQNCRFEQALDLYRRMPKRSIISSNAILNGFVQIGDLTNARNFFEYAMIHRDNASWNTLISGYQTEEALHLFSQMLRHGLNPDQTTYTTVASICGTLALVGWGKATHSRALTTGYVTDTLVSSSLISMYSKCGLIDDAAALFQSMQIRDTVTWNTIIVAQAYHGSPNQALKLYSDMIHSGYKPNHVTFSALLTACAHSGLVEDGKKYFKSMELDWDIVPHPEHCSIMVDLFGRSGLLYEAYELVKQLPVNFPSYAGETLLNYCKLHGNYELGKLASQTICCNFRANPEIEVIISNIYAGKGLWEESQNIRTVMKQQNVKKEVGCSWIELGGIISKFVYNDRSHPHTVEIFREVENLSVIIKKIGVMI